MAFRVSWGYCDILRSDLGALERRFLSESAPLKNVPMIRHSARAAYALFAILALSGCRMMNVYVASILVGVPSESTLKTKAILFKSKQK